MMSKFILVAAALVILVVGVTGSVSLAEIISHLPEDTDATLVKIDPIKNIAVISWSVSKVDSYQSNLLCSLYHIDRFGYPVVLTEFEITKLSGECVIDLNEVGKDCMVKGDYYVMIRKVYLDEKGEMCDIKLDDKRVEDPKNAKKFVYDPLAKSIIYPVSISQVK